MAANGRQERRLADSVDRLAVEGLHAHPEREERSQQKTAGKAAAHLASLAEPRLKSFKSVTRPVAAKGRDA
jgi:hypothetical protein